MRQIFRLLAILLFPNLTAGQNIVQLDKQWNIVGFTSINGNISTNIYAFQKDSIINGKSYLELYRNRDSTLNQAWLSTDIFMREDNDENRVYILENGEDKVIYDFNLMEGDSIQLDFNFTGCLLIVHQVDSITLLDGDERKRIRLVKENEPDPDNPVYYGYTDWVEGIGSMTSLTDYIHSCATDYPLDLLCYYENSNLLYINPDRPNCFITPIKKINRNSKIKIYPNPSKGFLQVESPYFIESIQIYDIGGQLIKKTKASQIDLSNKESGIYIFKIQTKEGIWIDKIIIE